MKRRCYYGKTGEKGFTLIEMAIVLIIIGLIIGAVTKGKDLIKSGEQKQIYTKFVKDWQIAYSNYYDRTGWILGDDAATDDNTGTRNGQIEAPTEARLLAQLRNVGLETPVAGTTGSTMARNYTDVNGHSHTLTLAFSYNAALGNHIQITTGSATYDFPGELGMAWDKIIDGVRDGATGDFLYFPANTKLDPTVPDSSAWTSPGSTANQGADVAVLRLPF